MSYLRSILPTIKEEKKEPPRVWKTWKQEFEERERNEHKEEHRLLKLVDTLLEETKPEIVIPTIWDDIPLYINTSEFHANLPQYPQCRQLPRTKPSKPSNFKFILTPPDN